MRRGPRQRAPRVTERAPLRGIDLTGIHLTRAVAASADRSTIAGTCDVPGDHLTRAYLIRGLSLPFCGTADFNGDGSFGTDPDIEAFVACLSGNCCPTCPANADFNGDGDVGTDADIESFFRVLAGGAC